MGAGGMEHASTTMASPVGRLTLIANREGLAAILWDDDDPLRVRIGPCMDDPAHPVLREAQTQLEEYFGGKRRMFSVALAPVGTPFQQQVWQELRAIPFGETRSYGELARRIGRPTAMRAVGAANGRNPLSIIVPCHRVIGSSGKLTGFAGGLAAKATLLRLEGMADAGSRC
jgi:methylated-DNA-[protein]-cysteine S-methyltransferase